MAKKTASRKRSGARTGVDFDTVRTVALSLPEVEEASSYYGNSAFKLRGQMIACRAINKSAEPESLVVRMDTAARDELVAAQPDVYYLTPHYVDYSCVLVRMPRVHPDAVRDLLLMSWKFVAAKKPRRAARPRRPRSRR